MKSMLLFAGALAGFVTTASASDLPVRKGAPMAPPITEYNWTGFYVGAQAGYINQKFGSSVAGPNLSLSTSVGGFVGGLHAGYNFQINRFVLGGEIDGEMNSSSKTVATLAAATYGASFKNDWLGSARIRLGYSADRILFYMTGGLAVARFGYSGGPALGPLQTYSVTRTGYTVGGGLEYAFNQTVTARIEYRYSNFGTLSRDLGPLYPGAIQRNTLTSHAVRGGVSYRF